MKRNLLILLWLLSTGLLFGQQLERYSRVRIDLNGRPMGELAALGIETDHGAYIPGRSLTTELSERELHLVQDAGFPTTVLIPDLQKWFSERPAYEPAAVRGGGTCNENAGPAIGEWKRPENYVDGTMGGYFRYDEMLAMLDAMKAKYPNLISTRAALSDTIVTHEGRPVWWVRISDNAALDEPEPEAMYNALHHAREPNSMSQMLYFMWYLLENYGQDPDINYLLDNTELYFIPCVNPDGYLYNEATVPQGGGYWRKNRRDNGDGTFGVDLNRNYGYQWGFNDEGSSPFPSSEVYRGPAPFSEPETRMMRDFCLQHAFKFAFNYHTFGNLLIYSWAYSDELADPALAEYAGLFTRENNYKAGTSIQTVGYRVNGSSDDWMFGGADIFSYTPEVGPSDMGFWPPPDAIDELNRGTLWQNLAAAYCLLRFGTATDRGGPSIDMTKPEIALRVTRFGFEDSPLTVSLEALTPDIASAGPPVTLQLAQMASADTVIAVLPVSGVNSGSEAVFVLKLDDGHFVHRDTLRKILLGPALPLFEEAGNMQPGVWSAVSGWNTTAADYVSAPTCITDSPDADYAADAVNVLELTTPVLIPGNAQTAQLRFFARWSIEEDFDYVLVTASSPGAGTQALCGRYTKPGSDFQTSGEPVFDGFQDKWVEECMDLADFIGEPLTLQFFFVSDGFQEFDGFYFDDLRVEYTQPGFVGTVSLSPRQFALRQNQPNPATAMTRISWQNQTAYSGVAELVLYNMLGEPVLRQSVDLNSQSQYLLDTQTLPTGQYAYFLRATGWQSQPLRMTVMHP